MDGVTAALAGPAPLCPCHAREMYWLKRDGSPAGGYWYCAVRIAGYKRANRERYPEKHRERMRSWQANNREHRRDYQRKWRYGVMPEEYAALRTAQGGLCAICGAPEAESAKGTLAIDHDHATGKVRGLLCFRCNTALERAERDGWLERAAAYVEAHR